MKATQLTKLERLIRKGTTAMEVAMQIGTTCPHKRISELAQHGWVITWKKLPGRNYGLYKGVRRAA